MNNEQVSKPNKIEISNLDMIKESVANAVERRNSGLESKDFLIELSDEEARNTSGGMQAAIFPTPEIFGFHEPPKKVIFEIQ